MWIIEHVQMSDLLRFFTYDVNNFALWARVLEKFSIYPAQLSSVAIIECALVSNDFHF